MSDSATNPLRTHTRARPLAAPENLREPCRDLRRLLQEARVEVSGAAAADPGSDAATVGVATAAPSGNGWSKAAVLVTGLPGGATAADLAAFLVLQGCGPVARTTVTPLGVSVLFKEATGAAAALALNGLVVPFVAPAGSSAPLSPAASTCVQHAVTMCDATPGCRSFALSHSWSDGYLPQLYTDGMPGDHVGDGWILFVNVTGMPPASPPP